MNKNWRQYTFGLLILILIFGSSCQKTESEIQAGPQISQTEIIKAINQPYSRTYFGAIQYLSVNEEFLLDYWSDWKSDLFDAGIVKWDGKFQCNQFALDFVSGLNRKYFNDTFHSFDETESLAVGIIWYKINADPARSHALIGFIDENKELWALEIQNGEVFKFTEEEIKTFDLKLFP